MVSLQKESEWEKEFDKLFTKTIGEQLAIDEKRAEYFKTKSTAPVNISKDNKILVNASIDNLKSFIRELLSTREKEIAEEVKEMPEKYPVSVFPEPWEGWEKDIEALAKSKGRSIDCVSAWYGRWQEKLMKEGFLQVPNHK